MDRTTLLVVLVVSTSEYQMPVRATIAQVPCETVSTASSTYLTLYSNNFAFSNSRSFLPASLKLHSRTHLILEYSYSSTKEDRRYMLPLNLGPK